MNNEIKIQRDREFEQNEIKRLNKKHNAHMFSSKNQGGKTFTVEEKIREFKRLLFKTKVLDRTLKKKIKPNKLIQKETNNLNNIKSVKYGYAPEQIESKSIKSIVLLGKNLHYS